MLNPHREITELALHLPPLSIQIKILAIKFLCKCLSAGDHMTSLVLQIEGTEASSSYTRHLQALKEFLQWKKGCRSTRGISLTNNCDIFYTKSEIESFQTYIWAEYIANRCQTRSRNSDMDSMLAEMIVPEIKNYGSLSGNCSLFRFETPKGLDSYIMDYVHGNCYIFGNVRASVFKDGTPNTCYFCHAALDSPYHQLTECTEVAEITQRKLQEEEEVTNSGQLIRELLFPTNNSTQRAFIDRVAFLKDQHEFIADNEYY